MAHPPFQRDLCVIGGGGHVGLPLALSFADCGLSTVIYDINLARGARTRGSYLACYGLWPLTCLYAFQSAPLTTAPAGTALRVSITSLAFV